RRIPHPAPGRPRGRPREGAGIATRQHRRRAPGALAGTAHAGPLRQRLSGGVTVMLRIAPIAFAAILHAGAAVAAAPLKLATLAPEGSPWHDLLVDIGQGWRTASSGQVTVRIYAGGVAGDEADMIRKMRIGQLQLAALTGVGLSEIAPEIQALQMPMMFDSYAELDYVRDRLAPTLE